MNDPWAATADTADPAREAGSTQGIRDLAEQPGEPARTLQHEEDSEATLAAMIHAAPAGSGRARPVLIGDKNYYGKAFEAELARAGIELLRPPVLGNRSGTGCGSPSRCGR